MTLSAKRLAASWCLAACLPILAADALAADWAVDFSGSQRTRFYTLDNLFRPGLNGSDQALSLRTLVKIQADRGPLTLVAEIQDSRDYLNDAGSYLSTLEINALEPLQLYAAYKLANTLQAGDALSLKAGLFTMALGSQRLVGRHGFRNTIQNYAGIQADLTTAADKSLGLFWVMPVKIRPADRQGLLDNHVHSDQANDTLQLLGVFYRMPLSVERLSLESYLLSLQESDKGGAALTADRELYTPGVRLLRAPAANQWDYEIEAMYQWGSRRASILPADTRSLDVSASFLHASVGRSIDMAWRPRLQLFWTRASGDRSPGDADFERFDGYFGPRREYGPTGIFGMLGRSNMQSAGVRLDLTPTARTDFFATLRRNTLVSATDSFASTGVRDASGLAGRHAGFMVEFRARHWLQQDILRLELGGIMNRNGHFFDQAPNATGEGDPHYGYADLTFFF